MSAQRMLGCIGLTVFMTACESATIPLVTPPVKEAAPEGLTGRRSALSLLKTNLRMLFGERTAKAGPPMPGSDSDGFRVRFFSGNGPTDIVGTLLPGLDRIIKEINDGTTASGCLTQEPVAYTLSANGETISMYAQCFKHTWGASDTRQPFVQFGTKEGVTYIYHEDAMQKAAVIVRPKNGAHYAVQAWLTVGGINKENSCGAVPGFGSDWDTCSYGVMTLKADQTTKHVELAVAGLGFGFCGAQLVTDGKSIYTAASVDMGESCGSTEVACLSAVDATTPATCTEAQQRFELKPIGRARAIRSMAAAHSLANNGMVITSWGASQYPSQIPSVPGLPMGTPSIVLDGTASDAVRSALGRPTAGVTEF